MKNLRPILSFLMILSSFVSFSQYDPDKISKKAVEAFIKASEKAQDGKYDEAIESLNEAVKRDAGYVDAWLSLGGLYGELKEYRQSVQHYEKAFALDTNYTSGYRLPYSINLAGIGEFEKALSTIQALLTKQDLHPNTKKAAEFRLKAFQFAVDYAKSHPNGSYVFEPKNLGDGVNTSESEYFPSIPIDGSQLIFTRKLNRSNEDFFYSMRTPNGWTSSELLSGGINTPMNEGALIISQDGKWLVFNACHRRDGYGSCDLYISYLTNSGWSEPLNLGESVNTDQWEVQPCLSPDKRDLYFTSNRSGGFGGSDIYVTHLLPNGNWSAPENLGPAINTSGDESTPFIHADNQSLYFTSNGLQGYGDSDLFVVKKKTDGKWGTPENLGYPINTIEHEGSLFIEANGRTAYFASDRRDTRGGLDLYSFELREDVRPYKTLWIKGQVFDEKTKKGLPSSVELIDLATKQPISRVQTDETGHYLITLPVGKDYAFNVNRRGYLFYSDNYSLKGKSPDSTYEKNIPLQPIEVNAAIVLRNIFFDFNEFELKEESQVELDKLVQLLKENPTLRIQIEGHTDNIGNANENLKLSENRAKAVINYLVTNGIAASRLSSKGYGAGKPVADNSTEEGRAQNRRTELKVIAVNS